jgi:hypothetical protein
LDLDAEVDRLDDAHLTAAIVATRPDTIGATVYAWNVERTLAVLRRVRRQLPEVRVVLGGPEVARDHPFLERSAVADALVMGAGEPLIGGVLSALHGEADIDVASVAVRRGSGYRWGRGPAPESALVDILPAPDAPFYAPDAHGVAYLEATRGCPLACAYCCYSQHRRKAGFLSPRDVADRIRVLRERGAREIRFIDPTFNSHPQFDDLLEGMARANRRGAVRFFAEIRAETLTSRQARLLQRANVTDIEVGVQSLDEGVLRAVRRPTHLDALDRGVRLLADSGAKLTLDVMAGLPLQDFDDVRRTLDWAAAVPGGQRVQFLHTLLLPGTELRRRWSGDLRAQRLPPYRVTSTRWLSPRQLRAADALARTASGGAPDSPTERFVGTRLPGLFAECVTVAASAVEPGSVAPGCTNRRAVIIRGDDLFAVRARIGDWMEGAVRREPHTLWQFILNPAREEPLDLLDLLADRLAGIPRHVLDRTVVAERNGQRAARRVFILLRPDRTYDRTWVRAAEAVLGRRYY